MTTPNLGLPELAADQAQKHVTVNEALRRLDAVVQLAVIAADVTAPPGSPSEGDRYIVPSGASGVWAGHEDEVAFFADGEWAFLTPEPGWLAVDQSAGVVLWFSANVSPAAWVDFFAGTAFQNIGLVGIGTTADASNPLSLIGAGALLSALTSGGGGTGDFTLALNKEASGDTLQIVLQQGFSTRALLGLLADNDLTLRVSPDGSSFFTAISVDKDTGNVGVGTTADANNALSVRGTAVLFTAAVDDLRFTFNKATTADDCALTFQSGSSARALVGLLGSDDFTFKVSPDGSTYYDALVIDKDNGSVQLPAAPKFSAYVNFDKYIGAGAWTSFAPNNARHNDQGAFDAGTGVFTAPHAGYYAFGAGFTFKANAAVPTKLALGLSVNGGTPNADARAVTGDATVVTLETSVHVTALLKLAAGDTVAASVFMTTNDGYVLADENYFWGHQVP